MKVKFAIPIWHQSYNKSFCATWAKFLKSHGNPFYNNLVFFGLHEGIVEVSEGLFEHLSDFESQGIDPGSAEPLLDSVSLVSWDWSDSTLTASFGRDFESSTSRFSFARRFWNQVMT